MADFRAPRLGFTGTVNERFKTAVLGSNLFGVLRRYESLHEVLGNPRSRLDYRGSCSLPLGPFLLCYRYSTELLRRSNMSRTRSIAS